jgi:hypothetical protein
MKDVSRFRTVHYLGEKICKPPDISVCRTLELYYESPAPSSSPGLGKQPLLNLHHDILWSKALNSSWLYFYLIWFIQYLLQLDSNISEQVFHVCLILPGNAFINITDCLQSQIHVHQRMSVYRISTCPQLNSLVQINSEKQVFFIVLYFTNRSLFTWTRMTRLGNIWCHVRVSFLINDFST